ncbi:PD-(D/E)XK motif protein [Arthrobacter sp. SDTb3-6]|uniref:PD-(D/E)XK motif protein n=1 Tax=Arthrobacter sp. SDTb3-6 TaxID=2713571 RepID=UPI00159DBD6C|nr:PD-(D/E)XK motif protein [Arthrobacter sp. SDTb3-6]NVM98428.1 PD-(D/E)XK motif protein [Arthrobacter sp. SDTb3-6]
MTSILDRWNNLHIPPENIQGFELETGSGLWLAVDSTGRRCVVLCDNTTTTIGTVLFETKGVSASIEELQMSHGPAAKWIVVVCRDSRYWEPFLAFAESLQEELDTRSQDHVALTLRVLRTWRWLWTSDTAELTEDRALGLIGELWFLLRWAGISESLDTWLGPEGNLHDFAGKGVSVEVKTSRSTALKGPVHQIASLQQLTPLENGSLYLFSLVISADEAAGNSLGKLVTTGLNILQDDPSRQDQFLQKLAQAGWVSYFNHQPGFSFRIVSEQLYKIDDTFPALTLKSFSNGIPDTVTSVNYALDMSGCTNNLVASSVESGKIYVKDLIRVD